MISEDAIERKPVLKKRILVSSLLALAAMGTHWLPGRTIVPTEPEPQRAAVTIADSKSLMTGPNSLLGDAVDDQASRALASTDLSDDHLDVRSVVDQAGMSQLLSGLSPVSSELAVSDGTLTAVGANAVPEPRTAGLLLLAAAPVLVRRKGRTVSKA